jgi:hypothetical protein
MKIVVFSLFLALCAHANNDEALALSGFRILENNSVLIKAQFRQDNPILISKYRYNNLAEALAFCKSNNATIEGIETALLIAMSGAATANQDLMNAITFSFDTPGNKKESGIWTWAGKNDDVVLMYDGRGTAPEVLAMDVIRHALTQMKQGEKAKLPAICKTQK